MYVNPQTTSFCELLEIPNWINTELGTAQLGPAPHLPPYGQRPTPRGGEGRNPSGDRQATGVNATATDEITRIRAAAQERKRKRQAANRSAT